MGQTRPPRVQLEEMIKIARCGCSGAQPCSCLIEAGPGITVAGSGSPGTPYVISVDGNSTTVSDTPTINMSILGSGTSGDPYVIFGSVKLDPSITNVLAATVNGLFLDCATIQTCVGGVGITTISDTSTINMTITGTGATLDPYIISATVKLSVTAGNLITADGTGIYLSCAQVRSCLSGGNGIDYNPATGVIDADISTDVGNTLTFGTDTGLYVPPGSGVFSDCGLTGLGTLISPLEVDTGGSAWPFACADTQGAAVYCGADGAVRVDPEKFTIFQSVEVVDGSAQTNTFAAVGTGPQDVGGPVAMVVTNPSSCRDMLLIVETGVRHAQLVLSGAGANEVTIGAHFDVVGSIIDTQNQVGHQRWRFGGGTTITFDSQRPSQRFTYTLVPSGSATFSLFSSLDTIAYNGSAALNGWATFLDVVGHSI